MRQARVEDYWDRVKRSNYDIKIKELNLNGINGFGTIEFTGGIFAICGLNGVGKSTIIAALKGVLGIRLDRSDLYRIGNSECSAIISKNDTEIQCKNIIEYKLNNKICDTEIKLLYIDYEQSLDILKEFNVENLEEYLEQYGSQPLDSGSLGEINYIIGKQYDRCTIREVGEDEVKPYFSVQCGDISYDSLSMGVGEHFLLYLYWAIKKIDRKGFLLIEEPETFISIKSQEKLMNYIAKEVSKKHFNVIITTHSPYIIRKISHNNIIVVSKYRNELSVEKACNSNALKKLGLEVRNKGIFYLEDDNARRLFNEIIKSNNCYSILEEYSIEIANGESGITHILSFPYSDKFQYKIIGIYDGDMKEVLSQKEKEKIKWPYGFLPGSNGIEEEFQKVINENTDEFLSLSGYEKAKLISALERISGEDPHDWFLDLAKELVLSNDILFGYLYQLWSKNEYVQIEIENFVKFLKELNL